MPPLPEFAPSARQGSQCDRHMRAGLGDSLLHLVERIDGQLPYNEPALLAMARGLQEGERYPPAAFALFAQLVWALSQGRESEACDCLAHLCRLAPIAEHRELLPWDDSRLDDYRELYQRLMQADNGEGFALAAPSLEAQAAFETGLAAALALLTRTSPALESEFNALVSQIVMVKDGSGGRHAFDGGSSYMLWGALFINVETPRTDLSLMEMLVHEVAHLLLYAAASDEPLVLNDDRLRYPSPLRAEPRPMDGIYHATWVSARMALAMHGVARSTDMTTAERQQVRTALAHNLAHFQSGHAVIAEQGELTPTGRKLMASAHEGVASLSSC